MSGVQVGFITAFSGEIVSGRWANSAKMQRWFSLISQISTEGFVCVTVIEKSKIGLNKLLLQVKASAFAAIAIPLAVYKTRCTVKIAIQNYF